MRFRAKIYCKIKYEIKNFFKNPIPYFLSRSFVGNESWMESSTNSGLCIVRHAGGEINGYRYTNSLEAIEKSLLSKKSIIELDFVIVEDGVCLFHDRDSTGFDMPSSVEEFKQKKILGKYTALTINDIIDLMNINTEMRVITDCKRGSVYQLVDYLNYRVDDHIRQRFIVQVYSLEQIKRMREVYPEWNLAFTLYESGLYIWDFKYIAKICTKYRVQMLTMPVDYALKSMGLNIFTKKNIKVFVHTVNDKEELLMLKNRGVFGIYTDCL